MQKIKLHKSEGYAKFNAKRQGLFITHKKGVYEDKETRKEFQRRLNECTVLSQDDQNSVNGYIIARTKEMRRKIGVLK